MSFVGDILGDVLGGITGAKAQAKAAEKAAATQVSFGEKAIEEQRAAREQARELQQPFVAAGTSALEQQMRLLGLTGGQQGAIDSLIAGPEYQAAVRQGEEALRANASATGGLRGGNFQSALFDNRANLVPNLLSQQISRIGGLTSLGQNAAAGVGNNGIAVANNVGTLLGQQGAALAGGQIARGNVTANSINTAANVAGAVIGF